MARKPDQDDHRVVARNKKARYKYAVLETVEAGLVLLGTEVKSLRAANVALADSFCRFRDGELYMVNCHISPYDKAHRENHEPMRARKVLLKKRELRRVRKKLEERGFALVPLSIYFTRGLAKAKLGLVRGKRTRDRREEIKRREAEREIRRSFR